MSMRRLWVRISELLTGVLVHMRRAETRTGCARSAGDRTETEAPVFWAVSTMRRVD